jgi:hypothetical protein
MAAKARATIREAVETPRDLRTEIEKQTAYIHARWSEPVKCWACTEQHSLSVCLPEGWDLAVDFPESEGTCPYSEKPVELIVTLSSGAFLAPKESHEQKTN